MPEQELTCLRCGGSVRNADDARSMFEQMHYVCFHYEFEHGEQDVDFDCGSPGCPSGMLPRSLRVWLPRLHSMKSRKPFVIRTRLMLGISTGEPHRRSLLVAEMTNFWS